MEWLIANKEWLLSGIGATIFGGLINWLLKKKSGTPVIPQSNIEIQTKESAQSPIITNNTGTVTILNNSTAQPEKKNT